ncbi:MAG: PHP domain-containing protein [Pseudomonadota bacterium]
MIDLHTHSTASDGSLSPAALVAYAQEKKLKAIAITDHDTVEGVQEALDAGQSSGIEVVPGIEISGEYPDSTLHILGYYVDYLDVQFLENISILQKARADRNPGIVKKLQGLGLRIELDEIIEAAGGGQVGRPHFAQVLVQKGYVKTPREAFERYLAKGAPAYSDKFRFPPEEAIAHIRSAGGIPVLGHPSTLNRSTIAGLESVVQELVGYGLMGIEVYYSDHTGPQIKLYEELAAKHNLLITGGSDFHGKSIKGIDLGSGKGSLHVPYACLAKMKKSLAGAH